MRSAICTLFDGHYHYGAGALVNSLSAAGYCGPVFAGYRGALPPWAEGRCTRGENGAEHLQVGEIEVVFVPVDTTRNLTNYKPEFMLQIWEQRVPNAERLLLFDSDIMVVAPWRFFEDWVDAGVAVVADGNTPMPANHPIRVAWRKHFEPHGFRFAKQHDYHFNGGFMGVHRDQRSVLEAWRRVQTIIAESVSLDLPLTLVGAPEFQRNRIFPFYIPDQDAVNIVTDLEGVVVAPIGSEGMGWKAPEVFMLHACMNPKPWAGQYLRSARRGRAPGSIDEAYWRFTQSPLTLFPPAHVASVRRHLKWGHILAPLGGWLQLFRA